LGSQYTSNLFKAAHVELKIRILTAKKAAHMAMLA